jgi:hypothetical protein
VQIRSLMMKAISFAKRSKPKPGAILLFTPPIEFSAVAMPFFPHAVRQTAGGGRMSTPFSPRRALYAMLLPSNELTKPTTL